MLEKNLGVSGLKLYSPEELWSRDDNYISIDFIDQSYVRNLELKFMVNDEVSNYYISNLHNYIYLGGKNLVEGDSVVIDNIQIYSNDTEEVTVNYNTNNGRIDFNGSNYWNYFYIDEITEGEEYKVYCIFNGKIYGFKLLYNGATQTSFPLTYIDNEFQKSFYVSYEPENWTFEFLGEKSLNLTWTLRAGGNYEMIPYIGGADSFDYHIGGRDDDVDANPRHLYIYFLTNGQSDMRTRLAYEIYYSGGGMWGQMEDGHLYKNASTSIDNVILEKLLFNVSDIASLKILEGKSLTTRPHCPEEVIYTYCDNTVEYRVPKSEEAENATYVDDFNYNDWSKITLEPGIHKIEGKDEGDLRLGCNHKLGIEIRIQGGSILNNDEIIGSGAVLNSYLLCSKVPSISLLGEHTILRYIPESNFYKVIKFGGKNLENLNIIAKPQNQEPGNYIFDISHEYYFTLLVGANRDSVDIFNDFGLLKINLDKDLEDFTFTYILDGWRGSVDSGAITNRFIAPRVYKQKNNNHTVSYELTFAEFTGLDGFTERPDVSLTIDTIPASIDKIYDELAENGISIDDVTYDYNVEEYHPWTLYDPGCFDVWYIDGLEYYSTEDEVVGVRVFSTPGKYVWFVESDYNYRSRFAYYDLERKVIFEETYELFLQNSETAAFVGLNTVFGEYNGEGQDTFEFSLNAVRLNMEEYVLLVENNIIKTLCLPHTNYENYCEYTVENYKKIPHNELGLYEGVYRWNVVVKNMCGDFVLRYKNLDGVYRYLVGRTLNRNISNEKENFKYFDYDGVKYRNYGYAKNISWSYLIAFENIDPKAFIDDLFYCWNVEALINNKWTICNILDNDLSENLLKGTYNLTLEIKFVEE